jgi:hypothetical protein
MSQNLNITPWRRIEGTEARFETFSLAADGVEWSVSRYRIFIHGEKYCRSVHSVTVNNQIQSHRQ